MPAESKAQRRFMGMVEHDPNASPAVAEAAGSMTKGQAHDFAATKEKGLPMHKHKHHKAMHGRSTSNEMGRRRNPRGGSC
jgi:hypothetical protein